MDRPNAAAARTGAVATAVLLLAACGWQPQRLGPGTVPGGAGPGEGPGMDHEVRYDVFCQECEVAYTAGTRLAHEKVSGTWSTLVRLESPSVRYVTLRASPTNAGGFIRRARIYINGTEVAEAERFGRDGVSDEVQLSAALPDTPAPVGRRIR